MTPSTQPPRASTRPIDEVFARLAAMYGNRWLEMWAHQDVGAVKSVWWSALSEFSAAVIERAMRDLGPYPPSLPEMVKLCRAARSAPPPRIHAALPRPRHGPIPQAIAERIHALLREKMLR